MRGGRTKSRSTANVFVTANPQPISKARRIMSADVLRARAQVRVSPRLGVRQAADQGVAEARPKGFGNLRPA